MNLREDEVGLRIGMGFLCTRCHIHCHKVNIVINGKSYCTLTSTGISYKQKQSVDVYDALRRRGKAY